MSVKLPFRKVDLEVFKGINYTWADILFDPILRRPVNLSNYSASMVITCSENVSNYVEIKDISMNENGKISVHFSPEDTIKCSPQLNGYNIHLVDSEGVLHKVYEGTFSIISIGS